MNTNKNISGVIFSIIVSITAGVYVNSMPTEIKDKLDLFFGNHPQIWIGGIVFVFFIFLINKILIKFREPVSKKDLEKRKVENKEERRKLFIHSLEKRYQQKLIQKTDERFSPPMVLKYTKDGIDESRTLFLDNDAKTENEICEELAVLLNKHRHLLILGQTGVGKTVRLNEMALGLLKNASENTEKPIPVIFNLATWTEDYESLEEWFVDNLIKNYNSPSNEDIQGFVSDKNMIPLLDGFDEIGYYLDNEDEKNELREKCLEAIHNYRNLRYNPMFVICSRNAEYINAGGDMAVNAQIEITKYTEKQIFSYLDNLIATHQTGIGIYENSNDNVAKYLKIHIDKTPVLLKVLCIPFYFNALFQVLNRRNDDKIDFPENENEIKNFILELYIERNNKRKNIDKLGKNLCWLAKWTKKKKKISFNLTDFNASCLYNPKPFAIISSLITASFAIFLFFYLFAGLSIIWSIVTALVIFVIGGGFKYKEEKDTKIVVKEVIEKTEDIEIDKGDKFQYHWKRWYRAMGFGLFSGIYFWLVLGIWKGLLCAIIVTLFYRLFVTLLNTSSPFIGFNIQRHRLEEHSRKDELRKWHWEELFTIDFWTHTIFEMYLLAILLGLIFSLFVKIFGIDWEHGFITGTIFGLTFAFGSSMESRAYQIKYYDDKADKPMKRLTRDLFVKTSVLGFSYFMAKFFICIYWGEMLYVSLTAALLAGTLGVFAVLLDSLFFKNLMMSIILCIEGKIPFHMNTFFNDCVKSHILEYENSSWKFSHQILTQFFIDNFSKPKEIKEIEEYYEIKLTELEEENIWEYRNAYSVNQYGYVVGLNLSNNDIQEIRKINSLTKLQELNLSGNKITKIENWSFFDNARLKRLTILDLSNNKISDVENLHTLTGLQILNLSNNTIKDISFIPSAFKRLQYLFVRENIISDILNIQKFAQMKCLCNLSIEYNPIERKSNTFIYFDKIKKRADSFPFLIKILVALFLRNPFSFKKQYDKEVNYIKYFNNVNYGQDN